MEGPRGRRKGVEPSHHHAPLLPTRFSRAIITDDFDGDKYLDKEYYMMFGAVDACMYGPIKSDVLYH